MDGQRCDKHPSAWAKARVILPTLGTLYFCARCANMFSTSYAGEFFISYEAVTLNA